MKNRIDDYFNNGIFEVARIGTNIIQRNILSEQEHTQMMDELVAKEPELRKEIDSLVEKIRKEVLSCDPLQLLSFSQFQFLQSIIGTTSEFQLMGFDKMAIAHAAEYIQSIYVSNEEHGIKQDEEDPSVAFLEISSDIEKLYQLIPYYFISVSAVYQKNNNIENAMSQELFEAQMSFWVRGQRYQWIEADYYKNLLAPHNEEFIRLFDLSSNDIIEGIQKMQHALSQGRFDPFNKLMTMFDSLQSVSDDDIEQVLENQIKEGRELISSCFGYKLNDVCEITGWNKRFVDELSFGLGEYDEFYKQEQYSGWPILDLPIQKRPFIQIDNKSYCFDYYSFSDNFYRAVQKTISRLDPNYNWSGIQQQASEAMVANTLTKLLPGCSVFSNNYYPKNGSLKQLCENDLIIQYYDILIIVEVKAGSFVYTSPMLDFEQHIKSYKKLIEEPEAQCQRTYDYIKSDPQPKFFNFDKTEKVCFDMSRINDIYMFSVTIDNINTFASKAEKLSFINSNSKAISIAIDDLMIYQDYFDSPLLFLHYIKNRRDAASLHNLIPSDELDHLGMYIKHNCYSIYFADNAAKILKQMGYREELDTYYCQKHNSQLCLIKPKQSIPSLFEKMVAWLDKSAYDDKRQMSNYLLDFSTDTKEDFSNQVKDVFLYQKETGRMRIVSSAGKAKDDLRYSCFVLQPTLQPISKNEQNDYIWSTMLWYNDENRVQINLVLDDNQEIKELSMIFHNQEDIPEEREEALRIQGQNRANERLQRYISIHGKKIGRNEMCPCGSGKKYKKCCGNKQ